MKLLIVVLLTLEVVSGAHWALLVAGSSGYYNYRHQVMLPFIVFINPINHGLYENLLTMGGGAYGPPARKCLKLESWW